MWTVHSFQGILVEALVPTNTATSFAALRLLLSLGDKDIRAARADGLVYAVAERSLPVIKATMSLFDVDEVETCSKTMYKYA